MGREVLVSFEFANDTPVQRFVESCRKHGWIPNDHGVIKYLADPDLFEWSELPLTEIEHACAQLEEIRAAGSSCAIILTFEDTMIGGSFIFSSRGTITFDPLVNSVKRADFPEYVDFEWYLKRLLAPLSPLGLTGYVATDIYP